MFRRRRSPDLIARVANKVNLRAAWRAVRQKKGQGGLDGISLRAFEANLDGELLTIAEALHRRSYHPSLLKRVAIPKQGRRLRIVGIPTVADRVVQHAILNVLEPYCESGFRPCSYGFRAGRSAHQAVQAVLDGLREGMHWVVEGDLEDFFDSLEWNILRQALEERIHDPDLLILIHRFLRAGTWQDQKPASPPLGIPQGAAFSPLLANVYLDSFDHQMTANGYRLIRYADDFLTLHRTEAEATSALSLTRKVLESDLKLRLNAMKTGVKNAQRDPFDFLGFRFQSDSVAPAPLAVERLKSKVLAVIRAHKGAGGAATAAQLNPLIRGWGEYFKVAQSPDLYRHLDRWINAQLAPLDGFAGPTCRVESLTILTARNRLWQHQRRATAIHRRH